ncbi:DUF4976 domain-containing protein, partial [candidate division KSB1 bacterium]|nr:DUF4976 domain-containing protein [candidate division KSB1 bacterium]
YPTLAELAGLETPEAVQGRSFARLLDVPGADSAREDAFIQVGSNFCLRTRQWAYMSYNAGEKGNSEFMLYDMENDPQQYTNLAGKSAYAEVEKGLKKRLTERIAQARSANRSAQ